MIIYHNEHTDPYFNLASEEYLIDTAGDEEIFMLWQNEPSVIIGRNQNAFSEVRCELARKRGIKVVRRLTGGGAVFHDPGNLNYTFISPDVENGSLNFTRFCSPITEALRSLGLDASLSGRNDITVSGFKVSGTAQCVRSGHIMHHGTLLWDADLGSMADLLRPDETKLASKGIKSVRSRVANIKDLLSSSFPSDITEFRRFLESRIQGTPVPFSGDQLCGIESLAEAKYSGWEWNYGLSKRLCYSKKKRFSFGLVELEMTIDSGLINEINITGDFFGSRPVSELEALLCGSENRYEALLPKLSDCDGFIFGSVPEELASLICE